MKIKFSAIALATAAFMASHAQAQTQYPAQDQEQPRQTTQQQQPMQQPAQQPMQQPMQRNQAQQPRMQQGQMNRQNRGQQQGPRVATRADDSWVTLSGRVRSATPTGFTLDYGRGQVPVSMDSWAWYQSDHNQIDGNRVIVYGRIDADALQRRSIDASSVYVENLNTFFYASPADEGTEIAAYSYNIIPIGYSPTRVTGIVTGSDSFANTITVDQGSFQVLVDISQLPYDPLDDDGYQQIEVGDRVLVAGEMDHGPFKTGTTSAVDARRHGLVADLLVTLREDARMPR